MKLQKASVEEFEKIRNFYWDLIDRTKDRSDTVGWKKGIYPSDGFLKESIENGELYIIGSEGGIQASVILNNLWNEGYNGLDWGIDCPREKILVPHALAVNPDVQGKGVGEKVVRNIIEIAKASGIKTVRLDILKGNIAAERLYKKTGFSFVQSKTMFYEDTGWTEFFMYELIL